MVSCIAFLILADDFRHNIRARAAAVALADSGAQVSVLAAGSEGIACCTRLGSVNIVRISSGGPSLANDVSPVDAGSPVSAESEETSNSGSAALLPVLRPMAAVPFLTGLSWPRYRSGGRDENAYENYLEGHEWDVLHIFDPSHIDLAKRAVESRRASGRPARWVYDARGRWREFLPAPGASAPGERGTARVPCVGFESADAVVTDRQLAADLIRDLWPDAHPLTAVVPDVMEPDPRSCAIEPPCGGTEPVDGPGTATTRAAGGLRELYRRLLGVAAAPEPAWDTSPWRLRETLSWRDDQPSFVAIGPRNLHDQGVEWGRAIEHDLSGSTAKVIVAGAGSIPGRAADVTIARSDYVRNDSWAQPLVRESASCWTHVLLESGRSLFGGGNHWAVTDAVRLLALGVRVGLIVHGQEGGDRLRPSALAVPPVSSAMAARIVTDVLKCHGRVVDGDAVDGDAVRGDDDNEPGADPQAQEAPGSPGPGGAARGAAAAAADFLCRGLGPVFVTTPDLAHRLPGSTWLPLIVDDRHWAPGAPVLSGDRPVVLYVWRRGALTRNRRMHDALRRLDRQGVVRYVQWQPTASGHRAQFACADIVIDGFATGGYGLSAVEAMATERIVIGNVADSVRAWVEKRVGLPLPIAQATPDTLQDALTALLADPAGSRERARTGRDFVRAAHDGRYCARVLREHLRLRGDDALAAAHTGATAARQAQAAATAQLGAIGRMEAEGGLARA